MKNIFRAFILILLSYFLFLIITKGFYAWEPIVGVLGWKSIVHMPEMTGQVVDATTRQPVENVIVHVASYKREMMKSRGGYYTIFNEYNTLTDKNGNFMIPSQISHHMPPILLGSVFEQRMISFYHPLYIVSRNIERIDESGEIKEICDHYATITKSKDKSVTCQVYLLNLEDKYNKTIYDKYDNVYQSVASGKAKYDLMRKDFGKDLEMDITDVSEQWMYVFYRENKVEMDAEKILKFYEAKLIEFGYKPEDTYFKWLMKNERESLITSIRK
jgi:hypothetical protein